MCDWLELYGGCVSLVEIIEEAGVRLDNCTVTFSSRKDLFIKAAVCNRVPISKMCPSNLQC